MQSEAHNTPEEHGTPAADDHGGHDETAASEENIRAGLVFGWGVAMFVSVLITIALLTSYFWARRQEHFHEQISERSAFGKALPELNKAVDARLKGYKALEGGRFQIPIEEAMKKVVEEGL